MKLYTETFEGLKRSIDAGIYGDQKAAKQLAIKLSNYLEGHSQAFIRKTIVRLCSECYGSTDLDCPEFLWPTDCDYIFSVEMEFSIEEDDFMFKEVILRAA